MTRRLALALLLAGLACSRQGAGVEQAGTKAADPASKTAPSSEGEGPGGTARGELAPWLREVFDPEPRRTDAWTYEVDTHSIEDEDPIARARGKVHCRSDRHARHELAGEGVALVACQACEFVPEGEDAQFEPELEECYVATAQGMWLVGGPPTDDDEARALVATPPYLAASPEPRQETFAREEDGFPYEEWTGVSEQELEVMGRSITAWCREDGSSLFYGWRMKRCFAPGLGLVGFEWDGRDGPSVERYELIELAPHPEP